MFARGIRKLVGAAIGTAVALFWFSLSDASEGDSLDRLTQTPAVALGGGAGTLDIEFEINQPAVLRTTFSRYDEATDEETGIDAAEEFAPGSHRRLIDVGPELYLYVELGVPEAQVGAEMKWTVRLDGAVVTSESERLTEPLGPNYAFFLQLEADGVEELRAWQQMRRR